MVSRVYVEAGCDIKRELYLGLLVDRATSRVTVMASTEGGMEIEEVAANHPEKILRVAVDPASGISGFHARKLAFGLGLKGEQVVGLHQVRARRSTGAFNELDCAIVEINPLVVTGEGEMVALDAKVSFDDNALFRHKDLEALRDDSEMDPKELDADAPRPELRGARRRDRLHGERRRAWPWRPWTSSSSTAPRRRTSSMWAARRMRRG